MYKLLDTDGYGMYIVDGNGNTQITSTLKNEIQKYLETHYKTALEQKKISADEVEETLNPGSVEEVSILLSQSNLYIRNINRVIDKLVDEKNLEQGLDDDKKILKDDEISLSNGTIQSDKELEAINDREKEDDGIKTSNDNVNDKNLPSGQKESSMQKTNDGQDKVKEEELPPEEKDVKEEIENAGIEESAIERIARENRVRPTQVNIRILGTRAAMDYVEELTGANLKSYRDEEVMVVRIPRVAENDLLYIADSRTGERIEIRGREHERTIADAEQVMKYRWRPGLDTIQPMKAPSEKEGQLTYMSYIDRNGTSKEARYINNGKVVDVDKERRDAYLKEVAIATKELKEAIEAHEKNPDSFTHKRVVAAMKARVNVDREFGVLSQQKKVTELSVENARKIVEDEDHAKINDSVHDEGRSIWDGPSHYFG
jgi:hypothetical protein